MKVSIVIPNWNGAEKLRRNLPKVLKVKGVDEIIVSDDVSTDNSVEIIEKEFPEVILVKRERNGGFSSNVNDGFKKATGELVFLLNNDAVPEPDSIENVLIDFTDPQVFSVSCNTGGTWAWAEFKDGFFWHKQMSEKVSKAHQTLWASGGSAIFRKSIWDSLGGLDELYNPFYEEDMDIGYRATKRGYINLWEPKSKVEHYRQKGVIAENFLPSTISQIAQRNQLIFIWKNITDPQMINDHRRALVKMLFTHPGYLTVFLSAIAKIFQIMGKRKLEEKEAKLTDQEILDKFLRV